jgi:hypothetical protein
LPALSFHVRGMGFFACDNPRVGRWVGTRCWQVGGHAVLARGWARDVGGWVGTRRWQVGENAVLAGGWERGVGRWVAKRCWGVGPTVLSWKSGVRPTDP